MVSVQSCCFVLFVTLLMIQSVYSVDEEVMGDNTPEARDREETESLMSKTISIPKLKKLMKRIDTNNDGLISREELYNWNLDMAKNSLINRLDRDMQMFDVNRDGKLTRGEIMNPHLGINDDTIAEIMNSTNPDDQSSIKFLLEEKVRFDAADTDGDGKLSKSEYQAMINPWGYPKMLNFTTSDMLKYDKDNDLKLNETEFKKFFYQNGDDPLTESQVEDYQRIMKDYDTDKDGFMSIEELQVWYAPDIVYGAKVETNLLFESADTNNDSFLSWDEILKDKERWQDSQATAYGDHIKDEL